MEANYRICTRCVMDTTDPDIVFDDDGICNHCHEYEHAVSRYVISGEAGLDHLQKISAEILHARKGNGYDCIIGVSGGVDSTFVAYKVKELGLHPLAVHLDNGWDSELAVKNIEQALKLLDIDLYTYVLDWEEFKDLQVAFLKASTPDSEIPTDHAIWALLSNMAEKLRVKYIISGVNVKTESHLPSAWSQGHNDWRYIRSVYREFGKLPLKDFPHQSLFAINKRRLTLRRVDILNFLDYKKEDAMQFLQEKLGWKYYGGKHYESIYTRFYQGYILPMKFGYDKRRTHLSSLVCSGQITRIEALKELEKPTYSPAMQEEDREYVIKKLGLTETEFDVIMNAKKKSYWDYPSYGRMMKMPVFRASYSAMLRAVKSYRSIRAR